MTADDDPTGTGDPVQPTDPLASHPAGRQTTDRPSVDPVGVPARRSGVFACFSVDSYPTLWLSGWCWTATRQLSVFLGAYLVNELTGSPLAVQLVGTMFFLPMFVGGILAGVVSDRFDRRRTMMRQLTALTPLTLAVAAVTRTGHLSVWMIYALMLCVGIGGVIDMTSRRALVIDLVGPGFATNAIALEAFAMASGTTIGIVAGGALLDRVGAEGTYLMIAGLYTASALFLRRVRVPNRARPTVAATAIGRDLSDAVGLLRTERALVSLLGVTVCMNFFFYSYTPMVPVIAKDLGVGPFLAAMLSAGAGLGTMAGSLLVAGHNPTRRGLLYIAATLASMATLNGFAHAPRYALALPALMLAALMSSGFSSTQSSIAMSVVADEFRGRAMGLVSMAIGALPFGMFVLGLVAERIGPPAALTVMSCTGIGFTIAWNLWHPELRRVR
jgi:predicted MFS family arabinose efflux permease